MINKFKDFLKKLSRKRSQDFSDQVDESEEEILEDQISDEALQEDMSEEDQTGDIPLPAKPSWKEKFKISLPAFRRKKSEVIDEPSEEIPEEPIYPSEDEVTGDTALPVVRQSWKDKISQRVAGLKNKMPAVNVREWKLPERMKNSNKDSVFSLSPSLSRSIEKFLSRDARETIHQVGLVVLICTITYTVGKMTALVLKGPPAVDSPRDYAVNIDLEGEFNPASLNQVKSINIFRTNTGLGGPKKVADSKCEEAQQTSNLPIKLVNTVVLQDSVKSLASVQIRNDRDLQELRVGDQISNLAKIFKIGRLEILIKNLESGICESISSASLRDTRRSPISVMSPAQSRQYIATKKMPGIENVGNKFNISKKLLDDKMKDIAAILTQARAIKIQNPDGTMSFKLTEMDPEGIFPYLGLQDQDIITSINGKPIYDMNEVMSLFARIKNLDKLQLGVKRDGAESTLDYNIQK